MSSSILLFTIQFEHFCIQEFEQSQLLWRTTKRADPYLINISKRNLNDLKEASNEPLTLLQEYIHILFSSHPSIGEEGRRGGVKKKEQRVVRESF